MESKLKNIFSKSECVSSETLKSYVDKKLSQKEMHMVEMHVSECEMCSDELEGLLFINDNTKLNHIVENLNEKVRIRVDELNNSKKKRWLPLMLRLSAAVLILLTISTVVYVSYFKDKELNNVISENIKKEESNSPETNQQTAYDSIIVTGKFGKGTGGEDTGIRDETISTKTEKILQEQKSLVAGSSSGTTTIDILEDQMDFRTTVFYDSDDSEKAQAEKMDAVEEMDAVEDEENGVNFWQDVSGEKDEDEKRSDIDMLSKDKTSLKLDLEIAEITIANDDISKNTEVIADEIAQLATGRGVDRKVNEKIELLEEEKSYKNNRIEKKERDRKNKDRNKAPSSKTKAAGALELSNSQNSSLDTNQPVNVDGAVFGGIDSSYAISTASVKKGEGKSFYNLAMIEFNAGNHKKAISLFEKEIKLDAQHYNALYYSAISYLNIKNPEKAIINLDKVLMISDGEFYNSSKWYKAKALILNDKPEPAKVLLREIINSNDTFKEQATEMLEELE